VFGPWERDTGLRDTLTPFWHAAAFAQRRQPAVLPATLPPYAYIYARDAAAGLLHLLDLTSPSQRVFNLCSGLDLGPLLARWCDVLTEAFPGFTWCMSEDPAAVTVPLNDSRPRGRMDIARLAATGFVPRFSPEAAFADYRDWLFAQAE
jgi:nucleoside-diphosphate-sugar epimerase